MLALSLTVLCFAGRATAVEQSSATEYQVKAAYLYNFAKFVQWPENAGPATDTFQICVLGRDPFGRVLDEVVAGSNLDGRVVTAQRVSTPQDFRNCRILFISSSEDGRLSEILASLDKAKVLTVSDMPRFSQRGGMIEFVNVANKVRFEINVATAQQAGLVVSSELLKVAAAVRRNPPPGT